MPYNTNPPWLSHIVLASAVRRSGDISDFYRSARAGRFTRLAEGVYYPSKVWGQLTTDQQFLARIHAVARASRPDIVFSHLSAAALWRLPIVGKWPARPEVLVGSPSSGPTRRAFTARQYPIPEHTETIDLLSATSLARTVLDVARTRQLSVSVAMIDHALRVKDATGLAGASTSITELGDELAARDFSRGRRRCREALQLSDGLSGSPGESVSRTGMYLLGLPMPILQHEFRDAFGRMIVDFWWPQFNLIGEFDGYGKYLREELRPGQSVADVVMAEKRREDRLRALGPRVTRWDWSVAISLSALDAHLRAAGLR